MYIGNTLVGAGAIYIGSSPVTSLYVGDKRETFQGSAYSLAMNPPDEDTEE